MYAEPHVGFVEEEFADGIHHRDERKILALLHQLKTEEGAKNATARIVGMMGVLSLGDPSGFKWLCHVFFKSGNDLLVKTYFLSTFSVVSICTQMWEP